MNRRGAAAIVMVVVLLLVTVIVIGSTITGTRDQDLTVRRIETVQSMYAAESGMNMAIRELMNNIDEDGDGGIGSISNDGNDANNPNIGGASCIVSASAGPDYDLVSTATENVTSRRVRTLVNTVTVAYESFVGAGIGTTITTFAELESAYDAFIGVTTDVVTFDGVALYTDVTNHYSGQGIIFSNSSGSLAGIYEEDDANVETLDGYDGTYQPSSDRVYIRWTNDSSVNPFTFVFDNPVARVGSFIGVGKEGPEFKLTIRLYDSVDAELATLSVTTDDFFDFEKREGFWGVIFDSAVVKKVTIRNDSTQDYANELIIDTIEWSTTPGPGGDDIYVLTRWFEAKPIN